MLDLFFANCFLDRKRKKAGFKKEKKMASCVEHTDYERYKATKSLFNSEKYILLRKTFSGKNDLYVGKMCTECGCFVIFNFQLKGVKKTPNSWIYFDIVNGGFTVAESWCFEKMHVGETRKKQEYVTDQFDTIVGSYELTTHSYANFNDDQWKYHYNILYFGDTINLEKKQKGKCVDCLAIFNSGIYNLVSYSEEIMGTVNTKPLWIYESDRHESVDIEDM